MYGTGMNIPYDSFKKPVCKGDATLGSACGTCEKCLWINRAKFSLGPSVVIGSDMGMGTGTITPLLEDVIRYEVKDGDVLFVNAEAVDCQTLAQHPFFRAPIKNFLIVPVLVPAGKTVADCLAVGRKENQ